MDRVELVLITRLPILRTYNVCIKRVILKHTNIKKMVNALMLIVTQTTEIMMMVLVTKSWVIIKMVESAKTVEKCAHSKRIKLLIIVVKLYPQIQPANTKKEAAFQRIKR